MDSDKQRKIKPKQMMTGGDFCNLPEDCIAAVFSFTTPKDAGRLAIVSYNFKSASESDAVWRRFLPSDYRALIAQSSDPSLLSSSSSAKDLYLRLCDHPVLIDDGKKSFGLDKCSGKKSFMLSARDLMIVWGDTPRYWRWTNFEHKSRFREVAELIGVCWLEIRGKIKASLLSPETHYTAYLVYKTSATAYGFDTNTVEANVGISGTEGGSKRNLYLDAEREIRLRYQIIVRRVGLFGHRQALALRPPAPPIENDNVSNDNNGGQGQGQGRNCDQSKEREDGWMEIELGDYYNRDGEIGDLEISVMEVNGGDWKGGLVIQGLDIRPKQDKNQE